MAEPFKPHYTDVHKDIERYLTSLGKRRKSDDGFIVFTGYDDGRKHIVDLYFAQQAYAPLVRYFRNWNWEQSYNPFLLALTKELSDRRHWPLLKQLWDGVLSKRRSHYNSAWRIARNDPAALSKDVLDRVKALLLETLRDIVAYATDFGTDADVAAYTKIMRRVEKGGKA